MSRVWCVQQQQHPYAAQLWLVVLCSSRNIVHGVAGLRLPCRLASAAEALGGLYGRMISVVVGGRDGA